MILLGVAREDGEGDARLLARKASHLRIFPDAQSKFNLSALETGGQALVVSQFTLLADSRKGRRPNFVEAAPPEQAEALVECFVEALRAEGLAVQTGCFGAHMEVEIHNDGPVTIILDSKQLTKS
jgi:D-tyrosyl-tRNA(Tyr) deacylase